MLESVIPPTTSVFIGIHLTHNHSRGQQSPKLRVVTMLKCIQLKFKVFILRRGAVQQFIYDSKVLRQPESLHIQF